jgi:hypothetical protein
VETGSKPHNLLWGDEDIYDFWGELWFIPNSLPSLPRARVRVKEGENLVWIRRDLWRSKSFTPTDCFSIREGDSWSEAPSKLNFVELFWGDKERKSFFQVVKEAMVGRGRGRGPRPR